MRISRAHTLVFELLKGDFGLVSGEVDQEQLIQLLQRHRLLSLSGELKDHLTGGNMAQLKNLQRQRTMTSLKLFAETILLLETLKEENIEAIPLKGAVLGYRMYNDSGKRHFNDIDLLVNLEDLQVVMEVLSKQGYQQAYPNTLTLRQERIYRFYKKDIGLRNPEKNIFIELHYGFYVHRLLKKRDEAMLRKNTEAIQINNKSYTTLDPETTFFYLVFHGCLHQYFRLFWLKDIADWMSVNELDYNKVIKLFNDTGLNRMLLITLQLLKDYFNMEIPSELLSPMDQRKLTGRSKRIRQLVNICHMRILGPENETTRLKFARHYFLFHLKPGLAYKLTVIWSILQRKRIRKYMGGN